MGIGCSNDIADEVPELTATRFRRLADTTTPSSTTPATTRSHLNRIRTLAAGGPTPQTCLGTPTSHQSFSLAIAQPSAHSHDDGDTQRSHFNRSTESTTTGRARGVGTLVILSNHVHPSNLLTSSPNQHPPGSADDTVVFGGGREREVSEDVSMSVPDDEVLGVGPRPGGSIRSSSAMEVLFAEHLGDVEQQNLRLKDLSQRFFAPQREAGGSQSSGTHHGAVVNPLSGAGAGVAHTSTTSVSSISSRHAAAKAATVQSSMQKRSASTPTSGNAIAQTSIPVLLSSLQVGMLDSHHPSDSGGRQPSPSTAHPQSTVQQGTAVSSTSSDPGHTTTGYQQRSSRNGVATPLSSQSGRPTAATLLFPTNSPSEMSKSPLRPLTHQSSCDTASFPHFAQSPAVVPTRSTPDGAQQQHQQQQSASSMRAVTSFDTSGGLGNTQTLSATTTRLSTDATVNSSGMFGSTREPREDSSGRRYSTGSQLSIGGPASTRATFKVQFEPLGQHHQHQLLSTSVR